MPVLCFLQSVGSKDFPLGLRVNWGWRENYNIAPKLVQWLDLSLQRESFELIWVAGEKNQWFLFSVTRQADSPVRGMDLVLPPMSAPFIVMLCLSTLIRNNQWASQVSETGWKVIIFHLLPSLDHLSYSQTDQHININNQLLQIKKTYYKALKARDICSSHRSLCLLPSHQ